MSAAARSDDVPPTPSISSSGWGATTTPRLVDGVGHLHGRRLRSGGSLASPIRGAVAVETRRGRAQLDHGSSS